MDVFFVFWGYVLSCGGIHTPQTVTPELFLVTSYEVVDRSGTPTRIIIPRSFLIITRKDRKMTSLWSYYYNNYEVLVANFCVALIVSLLYVCLMMLCGWCCFWHRRLSYLHIKFTFMFNERSIEPWRRAGTPLAKTCQSNIFFIVKVLLEFLAFFFPSVFLVPCKLCQAGRTFCFRAPSTVKLHTGIRGVAYAYFSVLSRRRRRFCSHICITSVSEFLFHLFSLDFNPLLFLSLHTDPNQT